MQSFGLRQTRDAFTVDTGGGLVFTVRRQAPDGSGKGVGNIVSLVYRGVEYQDSQKGSQINSGYSGLYDDQSSVTVDAAQVDDDHIKVTVRAGALTQYYLAHRGKAAIVMATVFSKEPKLGLVRFIARLRRDVLPEGPPCSDLNGTNRTVEAHDVFGLPDGETRSKHYSNIRLQDWRYFGAKGSYGAVWMVRDGQEGGSGGPFYRSLLDQGTVQDQELTYIVNYGEVQTEPFRTNIPASYALVFTDGAAPAPLDTTWLERMAISGWVGPEDRGGVIGAGLNGMDSGYPYTIGFANAAAQYWTNSQGGSGRFESLSMLPGTYRITVYKGELAVAEREVTVKRGGITRLDAIPIVNDPARTPAIWRIGHWDGMPTGLLNADKVTIMHPSDRRMAPWQIAEFTIGRSADATFPAYQWADVNSPIRIHFRLSPHELSAMTLRVGITIAYAGGRPAVSVNKWAAPNQPPSVQPSSRSLTVGSYRGNNTIFSFPIPISALQAGDNVIDLSVISGKKGSGFLSAGISYDAIDLVATPAH
ncbi:hypothetical protein AR540_04265 [Pseudomonas sp. EpS/L25]|nr:hypothetical protein AR540_04265 [Pseudomonas sp. EpS/L25]